MSGHSLYIEVTITACIGTPDGHALGDNVVDCTIGFHSPVAAPSRKMSDTEINMKLGYQVGPILAAIETLLIGMGMTAVGDIAEPMAEHASPTGLGTVIDLTPPSERRNN